MQPLARALVAAMVVLLGCQLAASATVATVSLDIGSEFIKIGLVKPGVPMDIVLNRESKRKTANVLAIRKGEREFGSDALSTYVKYPQNTYRFLTELLGHKFDSPIVERYQRLFPEHKLEEDKERGTVVFRIDEETVYSVEELVAMILEHVMELASEYAEVTVSSAVITVPPYFTQASRKSLLMAARLAHVSVIQLTSTPAAVGINYGVFRRSEFNETEQVLMFVDIGSTATTATVAGFKVVKEKDSKTKNPQLELKSVAYDRGLGGLEFDMRMRDLLLKKFLNGKKKPQGDITKNHRALAKLLTGAQKAKTVLSANVETIAQVEGLFEEINLKEPVTREEFEAACEDLFERVKKPVAEALKAAELSMDQVQQLIIIGGGVRIPRVQSILKELAGGNELGKNLNGDEAAALGAAYQAAANTKSFRVKKFIVKDINLFPIDVVFERETENEQGTKETRTISRTIFSRGNAVPQKKLLKFNFETDFNFRMNYGDLSFLSESQVKELGSLNISTVDMAGVKKAFEDNKDIPNEGVKTHFRLDESGVVHVDRAEVVFEKPPEISILGNIADSIGNLFGGSGKAEKQDADAEGAVPGSEGDSASGAKDASGNDDLKDAAEEEEEEDESKSDSSSAKQEESEQQGKDEEKDEEKDDDKSEEAPKEPASDNAGSEETKNSGSSEETEKKPEESEDSKSEDGKESKSEKAEETKADDGKETKEKKKTEEKKKPPKPTTIKVPLVLDVKTLDVVDLTETATKESKARMSDFRKKEVTKREIAKAKNTLETFIYAMQDKLSDSEVEAVSTEDERSTLREQLSSTSDWLYEDGADLTASEYTSRSDELNKTAKEIMFRVKERRDRPVAIKKLQQTLNMSAEFISKVKNMTANMTEGEDPWITEAEILVLELSTNETAEWLAEKSAKQDETPITETPVLKTVAIAQKTIKLERDLMTLFKKPKPKAKPKAKLEKEKIVVNGTEGEGEDAAEGEDNGEKVPTPESEQQSTTEETKADGADGSEVPDAKTTEESINETEEKEDKKADDEAPKKAKSEKADSKKKDTKKEEQPKKDTKKDAKKEPKKDTKKDTKKEETKKEEPKKDSKKDTKKDSKKADDKKAADDKKTGGRRRGRKAGSGDSDEL